MNKVSTGLLAVGLVVGFGLGYLVFNGSAKLGTASTSQALNSQALLTELNNINTDATVVRNVVAGVVQSSTVITGLPSISSSSLLGTSTVVTGLAASLGDAVLISPTTSTPGIAWQAAVETASTSNATFRIVAIYASSTANPGTQSVPSPITFQLTVVPFSSFKAPAALTQ